MQMLATSQPAFRSDGLRTYKQATLPPLWYKLGVVHRGSNKDLLSSHVRGTSDVALPSESRKITRRIAQYLLHAGSSEFRDPTRYQYGCSLWYLGLTCQ